MYLLYLDESGNRDISAKWWPESDFFILGGLIIKEECAHEQNQNFQEFKKNSLPECLHDRPLHARDLHQRAANSEKTQYSASLSVEEARNAIAAVYTHISTMPIEAIAVVIDNVTLRECYSSPGDPYVLAFEFVAEKFHKIINGRDDKANSLGLLNVAASSKSMHNQLLNSQRYLMQHGSMYVRKYESLLGVLNIEPMANSSFYEVADFICYAFQRSYRNWLCPSYGKKPGDDDYLSTIQPICTLRIGQARVNGKIAAVVFPGLDKVISVRGIKKDGSPET